MATEPSFVEYVIDQAGLGDRLRYRKMFGEYGFHLDGKFVAMACDNSFFLKATPALAKHGLDLPARPPYPGAKPYPVADELLDQPQKLRRVLQDTAAQLPAPKAGNPRRSRAAEPRKDRLLRFPSAVERDPAIQRRIRAYSKELGPIARHWFEIMRSRGDDVRELLHDGCPTVCVGDAAFAYVAAFTAHVNVGFFRGAELADPKGVLEGTGRFMRHVKIRPATPVDAAALGKLIDSAYVDMRKRLAAK